MRRIEGDTGYMIISHDLFLPAVSFPLLCPLFFFGFLMEGSSLLSYTHTSHRRNHR